MGSNVEKIFNELVSSESTKVNNALSGINSQLSPALKENYYFNIAKKYLVAYKDELAHGTANISDIKLRQIDAEFKKALIELKFNTRFQIKLFTSFKSNIQISSDDLNLALKKYSTSNIKLILPKFVEYVDQIQKINYDMMNDLNKLIDILEEENFLLAKINTYSVVALVNSEKSGNKYIRMVVKSSLQKEFGCLKDYVSLYHVELNLYVKLSKYSTELNNLQVKLLECVKNASVPSENLEPSDWLGLIVLAAEVAMMGSVYSYFYAINSALEDFSQNNNTSGFAKLSAVGVVTLATVGSFIKKLASKKNYTDYKDTTELHIVNAASRELDNTISQLFNAIDVKSQQTKTSERRNIAILKEA
jgi:hypothetical protein